MRHEWYGVMVYLALIPCIWVIVNIGSCVVGIADQMVDASKRDIFTGCYGPYRRVESIIPGFRFGCWLGGSDEEQ